MIPVQQGAPFGPLPRTCEVCFKCRGTGVEDAHTVGVVAPPLAEYVFKAVGEPLENITLGLVHHADLGEMGVGNTTRDYALPRLCGRGCPCSLYG